MYEVQYTGVYNSLEFTKYSLRDSGWGAELTPSSPHLIMEAMRSCTPDEASGITLRHSETDTVIEGDF